MTPLADRRARLLDAVYRAYGEASVWTPVGGGVPATPSVRRQIGEQVVRWGDSEAVMGSLILRVRRSELAAPAEGDLVTIAPDTFKVIAEPRLEPVGQEWLCEAAPAT